MFYMPQILISISSDKNGYHRNSTLIASVLNKTKCLVKVKYFCTDFLPNNINTNVLSVEFIKTTVLMEGQYPTHVNKAVFNRLQVIQDAPDWERCLIMDHDMLALCDLAPYFEEDFEGNLLMGRLFGPGNTLGFQMAQRGGLPQNLKYAADYPYFYMGPMMNLKAMREEGTWEKLLDAHEALGQDEQLALTIATEGRVKAAGRKWNLVPQWDHLEEGPAGPERALFGTVGEAANWKDGLPEGIIHWTGWAKPWHHDTRVWRHDLWEAEETSWEALRNGWWDKPRAVEVEPRDFRDVNHLARRGWQVQIIHPEMPLDHTAASGAIAQGTLEPDAEDSPKTLAQHEADYISAQAIPKDSEDFYRPFPDVSVTLPPEGKEAPAGNRPEWHPAAEMVRFGVPSTASGWLKTQKALPPCVVLRGPASKRDTSRLVKMGYGKHCLIRREDWPAGGPSPLVLEFSDNLPLPTFGEAEDLYLMRVK
jgi:lipopolysaccharide biosynthesis glycosyltransferase